MVETWKPRMSDYGATDPNRYREIRYWEPFAATPDMPEHQRVQWMANPTAGWTRAAMEPTGYRLGAGNPVRSFYERNLGNALPMLYDLARQGGQGLGEGADDMVEWAQRYMQQLTGQAPEGSHNTGLAANTGELAEFIGGLLFDREDQPATLQEIYQPQGESSAQSADSIAAFYDEGAQMLLSLLEASSFGVMSPLRRAAMMQEASRYYRDWQDFVGSADQEMPFVDYLTNYTEFVPRWGIPTG